jgi:molybdopterin/thiamine biosynthesis adenylyltransferase
MDAAWVHGRDKDARVPQLRGKRVVVLGCGSVGAPVALALAQAGIGTLALVDPDVLVTANLGRHPLGADALGSRKANALAGMIRSRLPHVLAVDAHPLRWDEAVRAKPYILDHSDLIVSAMGDWSAESALNEWHVAQGRRMPIVYGWTEAYACAGHAIAIRAEGGCLQCGFSELGILHSPATTWPDGASVRQEPACGASFQPYGPVELAYVTTLISELALDCLLGVVTTSTQRTWVARRAVLDNASGKWTSEWREKAATRPNGGFIDERAWPEAEHCRECGTTAT